MLQRTVFVSALLCIALVFVFSTSDAQARSLSFEDRVRAQEAIERVYHAHQIGATRSFDQVFTRDLLEQKVRTYLEQSVALEQLWGRPITSGALKREWDRIARNTRYPDRLREIAEALSWDPVLLYECVARSALANRLVGNFYATDDALHAGTRREAKQVRELLLEGKTEAASVRARMRQVNLLRVGTGTRADGLAHREPTSTAPARVTTVELDPGTYRARRSRAPQSVGQVGEIREGRSAFEIRVVLEEDANHARIASYIIPKQGREVWWREVRGSFDHRSVTPFTDLAEENLRPATERVLDFAGAFDPSCLPDDTWDNGILEDYNPARDGHSAVWTGTEMIIWGGGELDSGLRYDPLLDVFEPTSRQNAPSPRSFHTAVWSGSEMLVWGGWPSTATGGRYDPVQDSWRSIDTDSAPEARFDHSAVWTGFAMVVWGGNADGSTLLGTGGRYYPDADTWIPVTMGAAPAPRERHTAIWSGTEMIVWGGLGPDYRDGGGRYNPFQDRWAAVSLKESPRGKADHIAVWTGSRMIVWGGITSEGVNSRGGRYDPAQDSWSSLSNSGAPAIGAGEVGAWSGSEMLVWRGTDPGAQGRYDPVANSWSSMSSGPNGPPASLATAVWTGDEMIVWSPASGGRYDPLTDSWSSTLPLPVAEGPSDRSGHTAVWTGNQMIVWGGPTGAAPLGSRYDPLLETWTSVSTVGAPTRRIGHTAVWTGDEMIVWGGDATGSLQDTGGRYDPALDSWQATAALDAPQARDEHSAVWTGSRMLIWGGFVGGNPSTQVGCESAYTSTGAAYDPVANSWSATTTTGASEGQGLHTAVWTDGEMVVWGGRHWVWDTGGGGLCIQDVAVTDGGAYDLGANSWAPIATNGEPSARFDHTAVWTGSSMVIWGGNSGTTPLDSGGRYDPVSDSWDVTSLDGAPAPRGGHTAVWTGNEMVVWGGGSYLNSGSRYQPDWDLWRDTTIGGAPSARDGHTAVWTGDLMIVWGGSEPLGGRYAMGHSDHDGDGIADGCLACPDGPGSDPDADGVLCSSDNCPFTPNTEQDDDDGDGWGDACDPCLGDSTNDPDLDLVCHVTDNCASAYNPGQSDADADGDGDVCDANDDFDSLPDTQDNCRTVSNEDQTDSDGDGAGDACDPCIWDTNDDGDGDGYCDNVDNCPTAPNPTQSDLDADLAGDACDVCPSDPLDDVIGDGLCLAPEVRYPVGARPYSVATGDFDLDGFDDIATANLGSFDGTTLFNNGDDSFASATVQPFGHSPIFVRVADLNEDGIPDFVVINSKWDAMSPAPGAVSVLLGTDDGFGPRQEYGVGRKPESVAIDDYDLDGNLDLLVANEKTEDMSFLRGTEFGTFFNEIVFLTGFGRAPRLVVSGDLNNDAIPDFVLSIADDDIVQIYLGQGDGTFTFFAEGQIGPGGTIYSHELGDFNEDGTLDIAISHASESHNTVTILTGSGGGEFFYGGDFTVGREGLSLQVGDFNQDGHDDIVLANRLDWDISILTGDGNVGFASEVRLPVAAWPLSIAIGDVTGDGRDSIAVADTLDNVVSVILNRGPFGNSPPVADAGPNGIWIVPTESPAGTTVHLNGSGSTDADSTPGTADDIVLYEWYEDFGFSNQAYLGVGPTLDLFLATGGHRITLRTTDKAGNSDTDIVTVTVMLESYLPDLTLEFTPPKLWPPNHRLVEVQLDIIPGPSCSHPSAILGSIFSTEDPDAPGPADGETSNDIQDAYLGYPDHVIRLRAERSALNPGRTYYVTYIASCSSGNVKPLLYSFSVPYEVNGTAEPLQILLDETDDGTLVLWNPLAEAQHYDVIRGSLGNLQVLDDTYDLGAVTCIESNSADESTAGFEDAVEPSGGEVYFYLVQYHEAADSGYGTESALKPRIPGGGDCP